MNREASKKLIMTSIVIILVSGCSCIDVNLAEFERLPLNAKVSHYEEAAREDCFRHNRNVYLGAMAQHGENAVDAMSKYLKEDEYPLMRLDAIRVIQFVHADGIDLSHHPVVSILERIASDERDEYRSEAHNTLRFIAMDPAED